MTQIPDDILAVAMEVRREINSSRRVPELIIGRAILAERERFKVAAETALTELRSINEKYGTEGNSGEPHAAADSVLLELVRAIDLTDVADEYEKVSPKWYE